MKLLLTVSIVLATIFAGFIAFIIALFVWDTPYIILVIAGALLIPSLIPFVWLRKRKKYFICWLSAFLAALIAFAIPHGMEMYDRRVTIDVTPNINTSEYLPFREDSKIVKYDSKTLKLTEDLPIIDGATAAFPVYSAFVNAVYPETTELYDGVFEYNNTVAGYRKLAEKRTDIFLGAQPSAKQVDYARRQGTTFKYTQIGSEAFVFFVHKDNPIESLTTEQIKAIYSGEITNWKEVGGSNEKIMAFQRNEGSGSQSMMIRFMDGTKLMKPEMNERVLTMGGVIREVVDYKSKSGSIGFSFRYYVDGIIKNPDIKMIAVDGVAPSVENIKNGSYPIVTPVYAVTYENNPNPNVDKLIDWMLSDEGQYIIEETGYVGIK